MRLEKLRYSQIQASSGVVLLLFENLTNFTLFRRVKDISNQKRCLKAEFMSIKSIV